MYKVTWLATHQNCELSHKSRDLVHKLFRHIGDIKTITRPTGLAVPGKGKVGYYFVFQTFPKSGNGDEAARRDKSMNDKNDK